MREQFTSFGLLQNQVGQLRLHSTTSTRSNSLTSRHDAPGTNLVVRVACKEGLSVCAPGQAHALGLSALLAHLDVLGLELVNLALLLEIEDDDAAGCGSAEPVAIWRKDQGVDLITSSERVEMLGLVKIP
jgi:hypothetical protein